MTIHLPSDLESAVRAEVLCGRFSSEEDFVTEAVRSFLRELKQRQAPAPTPAGANDSAPDPILGLMRDDAELMDEIVADAYRRRREESWREIDV